MKIIFCTATSFVLLLSACTMWKQANKRDFFFIEPEKRQTKTWSVEGKSTDSISFDKVTIAEPLTWFGEYNSKVVECKCTVGTGIYRDMVKTLVLNGNYLIDTVGNYKIEKILAKDTVQAHRYQNLNKILTSMYGRNFDEQRYVQLLSMSRYDTVPYLGVFPPKKFILLYNTDTTANSVNFHNTTSQALKAYSEAHGWTGSQQAAALLHISSPDELRDELDDYEFKKFTTDLKAYPIISNLLAQTTSEYVLFTSVDRIEILKYPARYNIPMLFYMKYYLFSKTQKRICRFGYMHVDSYQPPPYPAVSKDDKNSQLAVKFIEKFFADLFDNKYSKSLWK